MKRKLGYAPIEDGDRAVGGSCRAKGFEVVPGLDFNLKRPANIKARSGQTVALQFQAECDHGKSKEMGKV